MGSQCAVVISIIRDSLFNGHFACGPVLVNFPLHIFSPFGSELYNLLRQSKTCNVLFSKLSSSHWSSLLSRLTNSFGLHCRISFNPVNITYFGCENHLMSNLLITKLTRSSASSSVSSAFVFLSFTINPHVQLLMIPSAPSPLWSLYVIGQTIIFSSCFFLLLLFFFT